MIHPHNCVFININVVFKTVPIQIWELIPSSTFPPVITPGPKLAKSFIILSWFIEAELLIRQFDPITLLKLIIDPSRTIVPGPIFTFFETLEFLEIIFAKLIFFFFI